MLTSRYSAWVNSSYLHLYQCIFLTLIKILHEVPMISNSGQQMHLQVAFGYVPSGTVAWTVSVPVSRYFHIFFCCLSIYLSELLVPSLLFLSHDPVFQRWSDVYTAEKKLNYKDSSIFKTKQHTHIFSFKGHTVTHNSFTTTPSNISLHNKLKKQLSL